MRRSLAILCLLLSSSLAFASPASNRVERLDAPQLEKGLIFHAPLRSTTGPFRTWGVPTPTYTRASSGTFLGSNGLIQTATSGVPRFDYGAAGNAVPGALIEAQVTNLALQSQTFANATWLTGRLTNTDNVAVGPDGTSDATRLQETAATGTHVTEQEIAVTNTTVYTWTVYLKAAERTWAQLYYNGASVRRMFVNLSTGTLGTVDAQFTARVVNVGNGWYRVSGSLAADETATVGFGIGVATGDTVTSYAGDATKGIDADGAQLETGSLATSYIPTTNATVTRAADVLTYPSAGNISATVGSISCWANVPWTGAANGLGCAIYLNTGANSAFTLWADYGGAGKPTIEYGTAGGYVRPASAISLVPNQRTHLVAVWSPSGVVLYQNGAQVAISATAPTITLGASIYVATFQGTSYHLNGDISNIRFYNRVLSATEVSQLYGLGYSTDLLLPLLLAFSLFARSRRRRSLLSVLRGY